MATYTVKKGKEKYKGTNGKDIFKTEGKVGSFTINALGGNDKIYIGAGSGKEVSVGTGADYVEVTGGKVNKIRLSAGTNTIKITGGQVNNIVGDGTSRKTSDIITVSSQKTRINITTSNGDDKVTVNGIHNSELHRASRADIETNSGNDTITINNGGFNRIKAGYGTDKITINGGSNYVLAGSSKDTIVVNSKYGNYINGQGGDDTITLGKSARRCYAYGESGNDTINVKSTATGKVGNFINGGNGHDTINVNYKSGMSLVVDARQSFSENRDTVNIISDYNESVTFKYYKKYDVMEISDHFHIVGFKQLRDIGFDFGSGNKSVFNPTELIDGLNRNGDIVISDSRFDIDDLFSNYKLIKNYVDDAPSLSVESSKSAIAMGYKKY